VSGPTSGLGKANGSLKLQRDKMKQYQKRVRRLTDPPSDSALITDTSSSGQGAGDRQASSERWQQGGDLRTCRLLSGLTAAESSDRPAAEEVSGVFATEDGLAVADVTRAGELSDGATLS